MSKLAWHSAFLVAGKVFSGLATIASGVVLARWLTVEEYGTYSQLILIASTLVLFSSLSLPRSLYYFVPQAQNEGEKKIIAVQIILLTVASSLLFAFLLFPASPFLAKFMQNELIEASVFYVAVYLFFLSVSGLFEPLLVSLGHAKVVAGIESFTGLALLLAVVLPLYFGLDYRNILFCMSLVLALKMILLFYFLFKLKGCLYFRQLFQNIIQKIKYSAPLAIGSMIGIVGRRIDQFIISAMFLPTEYALYARGAFELPLVAILPMTISNLMLPGFVKDLATGRRERVAWQFADKARKLALLFFPLTVLMFVLSEAFIVFLFSEKYLGSVPVFKVYLLLLPIRITIHGIILRASGHTQKFIVGDLLCVISNVVISVLLIKAVGMTGAAWGTVISIGLYTIYILSINCRVLGVTMFKIFPWRDLSKIMSVAIIAGVVSFLFLRILDTYIVQLTVIPVVFSGVYLIVGYFFKIYTDGDILLCKEMLGDKFTFLKRNSGGS